MYGASLRFVNAAQTARYSGSPAAPISLQRSRTAIFFTVSGSAARNISAENGLNRWTCRKPTFSPAAFRTLTVSRTVPLTEPMATITRSASGAPK